MDMFRLAHPELPEISDNEIERRARLSTGHISRLLHPKGGRGSRGMSFERVDRLAEVLGVATIWLASGKGGIERDQDPSTPTPPDTRPARVRH